MEKNNLFLDIETHAFKTNEDSVIFDFTWQDHLGNKLKVKDMSDEHIANTIQHIKFYRYSEAIIEFFLEEAERRKLSEKFLAGAQYPYKDGKGHWLLWNFVVNGAIIIGEYKDE